MAKIRSQDHALRTARSQLEKLRARPKHEKPSSSAFRSQKPAVSRSQKPSAPRAHAHASSSNSAISRRDRRAKTSPLPASLKAGHSRAISARLKSSSEMRAVHTPPLSRKTKELAMKVCSASKARPGQSLSSAPFIMSSPESLRSIGSRTSEGEMSTPSRHRDIDEVTFSGALRVSPGAHRRQANELSSLRRKHKQLQAKFDEAHSSNAVLTAKVQTLQRALNIRASELGLGRQKGPTKLVERSELVLEVEEANQRYGDLVERHAKLQSALNAKESEVAELRAQLDAEVASHTEGSALVADLESRCEALRVCRTSKEDEAKAAEAKMREVQGKFEALQAENASLTERLSTLDAKSQEAKKDAEDSKMQIEALQRELRESKAEVTRLSADNLRWQRRFPVLPALQVASCRSNEASSGKPDTDISQMNRSGFAASRTARSLPGVNDASAPLSQQLKTLFNFKVPEASNGSTPSPSTNTEPRKSDGSKLDDDCARCNTLESVQKSVAALVRDTRALRSEVRSVNEKCLTCEDLVKESRSSVREMRAELSQMKEARSEEVSSVLDELRRKLIEDLTRRGAEEVSRSPEANGYMTTPQRDPSPHLTPHTNNDPFSSGAHPRLYVGQLTTPEVVRFQRTRSSPL